MEVKKSAPSLLSKRDVAKRLGVSVWTIDRFRKNRALAFPQPIWVSATMPRWDADAIEQWIASRPRGGPAPSWDTDHHLNQTPQQSRSKLRDRRAS